MSQVEKHRADRGACGPLPAPALNILSGMSLPWVPALAGSTFHTPVFSSRTLGIAASSRKSWISFFPASEHLILFGAPTTPSTVNSSAGGFWLVTHQISND